MPVQIFVPSGTILIPVPGSLSSATCPYIATGHRRDALMPAGAATMREKRLNGRAQGLDEPRQKPRMPFVRLV